MTASQARGPLVVEGNVDGEHSLACLEELTVRNTALVKSLEERHQEQLAMAEQNDRLLTTISTLSDENERLHFQAELRSRSPSPILEEIQAKNSEINRLRVENEIMAAELRENPEAILEEKIIAISILRQENQALSHKVSRISQSPEPLPVADWDWSPPRSEPAPMYVTSPLPRNAMEFRNLEVTRVPRDKKVEYVHSHRDKIVKDIVHRHSGMVRGYPGEQVRRGVSSEQPPRDLRAAILGPHTDRWSPYKPPSPVQQDQNTFVKTPSPAVPIQHPLPTAATPSGHTAVEKELSQSDSARQEQVISDAASDRIRNDNLRQELDAAADRVRVNRMREA